ncbi:hypothetical protein D9611_004484 [Ephemerocybe angulata]|uniref:Uncharacterized protein n=1 Tax=Ephemerocybe angulata TaxID=980116 RepID=A0A8H5BJG6_9AGAR|nr:hypothetical protein D9611_004484 [Tulosesus angulatus]
MTSPVQLYVYDLSNGMAKQLSMQLTGRQIDGIWHTSVVVFGKEVFYGQGISITQPGRSHHGAPLEIIPMGETALDEDTFQEYLAEMRDHYTADKYHLLEFNCNSFTNDCVGFLTGGTIPSHISDLPTDFLSTPFGAALRPTIDSMYRRGPAGAPPSQAIQAAQSAAASAPNNPQLAASILQAVAAQAAQANGSGGAASQSHTLTAPVHIITNSPNFQSFLKSHRAAVGFFTSQTCPPCRMIEPVFERLADEKGMRADRDGAGFAKIDLGVGMGNQLAGQYGVRATPTFIFFLDGKKVAEVKGADAGELRTQIDLLLFQAYPPHPHSGISAPTIKALSLNPILFKQVPAFDAMFNKLYSFIDGTAWPASAMQTQIQIKDALSRVVLPYLKSRFPQTPSGNVPSASATILEFASKATDTLVQVLLIESLFPVVDIWRLALLDPFVSNWIFTSPAQNPITLLLPKAIDALQAPSKASRNYILTVLRMLANGFANPASARWLMLGVPRESATQVLIPSLLHDDATVRTAAASLAFNLAAALQKPRVDAMRNGTRWTTQSEGEDVGDWEVEMASAITEAIDREKDNEEIVHRLTACLAFLVRLSPGWESNVKPLLEVLQTREILKGKLRKGDGWNGASGVTKKEIRRLVEEVADKLCTA